MKLLENEKLIAESNDQLFLLTTHRIRCYESHSNNANFTSIMVDEVSSVELTYQSNIWLLVIGILTIPVIFGVILVALYFTSKRHMLCISPNGGRAIYYETKGFNREFLEELIHHIEKASYAQKQKQELQYY